MEFNSLAELLLCVLGFSGRVTTHEPCPEGCVTGQKPVLFEVQKVSE